LLKKVSDEREQGTRNDFGIKKPKERGAHRPVLLCIQDNTNEEVGIIIIHEGEDGTCGFRD